MTTDEFSFFTCIEMAVFPAISLTSSFIPLNDAASQPIGAAIGFSDDIKILKLYNDSSTGVTLSYDGIVSHDYLPSKGTMIIDLQASHACNSAYSSGTKYGRKGQIIYGLGDAGEDGENIYITGYR